MEVIMRVGRTIIIPAVLALGVAGSVLAAVEASAATEHVAIAHVQTVASSPTPDVFYHT
jgi:hypothetical protein